MNLIETRSLKLELGGRTILDGVNLSVARGDFLLVIGPNGAGKSSLLKCILALIRDYDGSVLLEGRDNRRLTARERARLIAYVPQLLDLQFNLDVYSLMELSRFAYEGEPRALTESIIDACLAMTESLHLKDAFLDELSGGERQRVLIASALAQKPKILILDEPSQSLDPGHRVELVKLLARLDRDEHLTIILVTHDWNEYAHLKARVLALKQGRIAFTCELNQLHDHLDPLFECNFHHFSTENRTISIPRC